jgi:hypothetical protein
MKLFARATTTKDPSGIEKNDCEILIMNGCKFLSLNAILLFRDEK